MKSKQLSQVTMDFLQIVYESTGLDGVIDAAFWCRNHNTKQKAALVRRGYVTVDSPGVGPFRLALGIEDRAFLFGRHMHNEKTPIGWLYVRLPALNGRTPKEALDAGDVRTVEEVFRKAFTQAA